MRYSGGAVLFLPRFIRKIYCVVVDTITTALLRLAVAQCGSQTRFSRGVYVQNPAAVTFGDLCFVGKDVTIGTEIPGQRLTIGDHVQINAGVMLDHTGVLTIGSDVMISEDARIYSHDHGFNARSKPLPLSKQIGDKAWIGARAIILPQCRVIGEGAIIGAGSVVARDVPAYGLVVGNPARLLGDWRLRSREQSEKASP